MKFNEIYFIVKWQKFGEPAQEKVFRSRIKAAEFQTDRQTEGCATWLEEKRI